MRHRTAALVLLLTLAAAGATRADSPPVSAPKPLPPGVVQIEFDDLHCKTCVRKLARKLYTVRGVVRVKADLKRDLATVTLQPKARVAPLKLWEAAVAAKLQPTRLSVADQRLTAKDFPQAKTAAKNPHSSGAKR